MRTLQDNTTDAAGISVIFLVEDNNHTAIIDLVARLDQNLKDGVISRGQ